MKQSLIRLLGETPNNFLEFAPKFTNTGEPAKPLVLLVEYFKKSKRTESGMRKLMEKFPLYNFGTGRKLSERELLKMINEDNVDESNIILLVKQIERSLLKERIEAAIASFRTENETILGDWVVIGFKGSAQLGTQYVFPRFYPSDTSNEDLVNAADKLISKRWNVRILRVDDALSAVEKKELAVEVFTDIKTHYATTVRDTEQA
jgi:hypothetical protein